MQSFMPCFLDPFTSWIHLQRHVLSHFLSLYLISLLCFFIPTLLCMFIKLFIPVLRHAFLFNSNKSSFVGLYKTLFRNKVDNHIYRIRASTSEMTEITSQTSSALSPKEYALMEKVERSGEHAFQADNGVGPLYRDCQK